MRKILHLSFLLLFFIAVSGCASQNVPLDNTFWKNKQDKVAVANTKFSPPGLYQEGREGLLDIAINSAVTHEFDKHLEKYNTKSLYDLKYQFVSELRDYDIKAFSYQSDINLEKLNNSNLDANKFAEKSYLPYANEIGTNRLLVFSVLSVGAARAYYGFIPLGAPVAICALQGQLIDVPTNRILWRQTVSARIPVGGEWDQPPHYPNFDKALDKAITSAKLQLLSSFFGEEISNK